jgi:predicted site-specific integrase-resolvase
MAGVSTLLVSARHETIGGIKMILYRPKDVQKLLGVTKPTYYKWLKAGILKKAWPVNVPALPNDYYITDLNIREVKERMAKKGWKQGKALIKKEVKKKAAKK